MRTAIALVAVMLVLADAPAFAQDQMSNCPSATRVEQVVLTTSLGTSIRGTLLCLSPDGALLLTNGKTVATPLAMVRRIESREDPLWDGAVKGAAIPLIFWAIFCRDCSAEPMLKSVAAYGLVGLTLDSLQNNAVTIYSGRARPQVSWRLRF